MTTDELVQRFQEAVLSATAALAPSEHTIRPNIFDNIADAGRAGIGAEVWVGGGFVGDCDRMTFDQHTAGIIYASTFRRCKISGGPYVHYIDCKFEDCTFEDDVNIIETSGFGKWRKVDPVELTGATHFRNVSEGRVAFQA